MADFAFKSYMNALNVDMSTMTIVDQAPPDGAKSLADGAVDMASTLTLAGNADFNGDLDVDGTAN